MLAHGVDVDFERVDTGWQFYGDGFKVNLWELKFSDEKTPLVVARGVFSSENLTHFSYTDGAGVGGTIGTGAARLSTNSMRSVRSAATAWSALASSSRAWAATAAAAIDAASASLLAAVFTSAVPRSLTSVATLAWSCTSWSWVIGMVGGFLFGVGGYGGQGRGRGFTLRR